MEIGTRTSTADYTVVCNHEEQYSIWPADRPLPAGWRVAGPTARLDECLAHIDLVWTDLRPLRLRRTGRRDGASTGVGRVDGPERLERAELVERVELVERPELAEPAELVERVESAKRAKRAELAEPAELVERVESVERVERTERVERVELGERAGGGAAGLSTWSAYLAGAPVALDLPADRPGRRGTTQRYALALPDDAPARVADLARVESAAPRDVWLAVLASQLLRYTAETDLVIAGPHPAGPAALRLDLSGEPSFREVVRRAADAAGIAGRLGGVAVADLLRARAPEGTEPLPFPVGFDLADAVEGPVPAGLADGVEGPVPADLTVRVHSGRRPRLLVDHDPAGSAGARFAEHYRELLASALAAPDVPVTRLGLVPPAERRRLLVDWNATPAPVDPTRSLATCVAEVAARTPDAVAVIAGPVRLTYGELDAAANRLAHRLRAAGASPGRRVGLLLERSADCVTGLLAILKTGAAAVMLDPDNPGASLAAVLADAEVASVVTRSDRLAQWAQLAQLDGAIAGRAVCVDGDGTDAGPSDPVDPPADPDGICLVFYTSGSTGEPKGVLIRHETIANIIEWTRHAYGVTDRDRTSWLSSPGFAIACQELIPFLGLGATVCVADAQTARAPESIRDWLIASEVTHCVLVAPLAERMWPLPWPDDVPLRFMYATGASVRRWAPDGLPYEVIVFYATTETLVTTSCYNSRTGLRATTNGVPPANRQATPPVGRPISNVRVYVLDAHGEPVPTGVVGELFVAGAGVGAGYLNKPELSAERFVPHGLPEEPRAVLYRTGDLARWHADGVIEVIGRADGQVKIRGYRVEPTAVENAIEELPGIREATVLARRDALVAYVVPATAEPPATSWLRERLAERLPHYMVPTAVVILDELPRLVNGKLDRRSLPAPGDVRAGGPAYRPPRDGTEHGLAATWAAVLGVERVGADDDFFELGGHSLLAVDLIDRLAVEHGFPLRLTDLYEAPTVARLADLIDNAADRVPDPALPAATAAPARRHDPFPLTDTQYAYWIGRGSAVELGNVGCHGYFEWQSPTLDVDRLRGAWQRLVDRHDALRLVILPDGTQRVVERPPPYEIAVLDLTGRSVEAAEAELAALREQLAHQVLPADRWPLFDVRLSRLPDGQVRLHLSFDLLIVDAWSYVQILIPDLVRYYEEPAAELPALDLTFRDYVVATADALEQTEAYGRARQYWLDRLCGLLAAPDLPAVVPDRRGGPVRFHRRTDQLTEAEWSRLTRRAGARGVTPTCLLVATYAEVLRTWSKNDRFTINCPLFNRLPVHPRVNEIVGDFTTTSLLAVERVDGTFTERAQSIQRQMWQDLEHRHFGGVRVLRELNRLQGNGIRAAFPVVLTSLLGQPPRYATALGDPVYAISQTPQVSIDFQAYEEHGRLRYNWDSLDGLFPAGMVEDMFDAHRRLLRWLAGDGEESWSRESFCLVPSAQLELRAAIGATDAPLPAGLLHTMAAAHAARTPAAPAVITMGRVLDHREFAGRVNQVGRRLRDLGARPNRLVAVVMEKGWEQIVATHGVLASGAAYMSIDPTVPTERLHHLLAYGEVEIVLTQSRLDPTLAWPAGVRRLRVDRDFEDEDTAELPPVQQPTDLAYVIFTSGSTGVPKGVMVDHRAALNAVFDINRRFDIGPGDRCIAVSPLQFDLSAYDTFGLLAAGGAVAVPDPSAGPDPAGWAALMDRAEVTFWNSAPTLMEMLVSHLSSGGDRELVRRLRLAILAGDWIPVTLPDRLRALNRRVEVVSGGGPAEASFWSVLYRIGAVDPAWASIPYGRPMTNQRYHILDAQRRERPTWVPGEIHIASDVGLARGYWRDEERTAAQFRPLPGTGERAYATGDVGRYLPDGNIELLGREDFQVKIQGIRIELGEIEAMIRRYPAVRSCVVVAAGASRDLAVLHAFVVWTDPGLAEASGPRLRAFLADRLPGYMVPAFVTALESLPLTRNGKVDRVELASRPRTGDGQAPEGLDSPATAVERVVCEIWAELLGVTRVGRRDDFFGLGGNSLIATRLVGHLRELLDAELSLHELFVSPTVADVCAAVTANPSRRSTVLALAEELIRLPADWVARTGTPGTPGEDR